MGSKKIVLIIAEGMTEDIALGVVLSQLYDKNRLYVHILKGDITTRENVIPQNIVSKLGNEVRNFAKCGHYRASDFKQIIHLVDTDGAYIPDERIVEDPEIKGLQYNDDGIYTGDVKAVMARNAQKRNNLYRLKSTGQIWGVPYAVYYMSCNLDHVLYDKRNNTEKDKTKDAYAFASRYNGKTAEFAEFIAESHFSVTNGYAKSWQHIETGMNSLKRYTNFGICIAEELNASVEK